MICPECDGTGWARQAVEAEDGNFEEAHYICSKGCQPRRCTTKCGGPDNWRPCPAPGVKRVGDRYLCPIHEESFYAGEDEDEWNLAATLLAEWIKVARRYENEALENVLLAVLDYSQWMRACAESRREEFGGS